MKAGGVGVQKTTLGGLAGAQRRMGRWEEGKGMLKELRDDLGE